LSFSLSLTCSSHACIVIIIIIIIIINVRHACFCAVIPTIIHRWWWFHDNLLIKKALFWSIYWRFRRRRGLLWACWHVGMYYTPFFMFDFNTLTVLALFVYAFLNIIHIRDGVV
jgi:hypothetical protein